MPDKIATEAKRSTTRAFIAAGPRDLSDFVPSNEPGLDDIIGLPDHEKFLHFHKTHDKET